MVVTPFEFTKLGIYRYSAKDARKLIPSFKVAFENETSTNVLQSQTWKLLGVKPKTERAKKQRRHASDDMAHSLGQ